MNLNSTRLETVIQAAFDAATEKGGKDSRRWQTAIARAKQELEANPFLHFTGDALLILSPSGEIYEAARECQCKAWTKGKFPCWHRAAWRIVSRYNERGH